MAKKTKIRRLPSELLKKSKRTTGPAGVSNPQNLLRQALAFQQAGRLQQAEALYRQILSAEPTHPEALHHLGMLAHQVGKNEIAIELISKALNRRPDYVEACYNLGFVLLTEGRTDEAVTIYQQLLTLKPDYVEAHNNLGNAYLTLGKLEEAADSFRQALTLRPNFIEAHNNLGLALKAQGKLNEAIVSFRRALVLKPDFAEAHTNLGNTFLEQGKLGEAVTSLRQALTLKPDFTEAHYLLGVTLMEQGKDDEAAASFQRTLAVTPHHLEALNHLGRIFQEQDKPDEALASFRQALALNPDSAEAHYNIGITLHEQGKLDEAVASYRRALILKPDYAKAYNNLGFTLRTQTKIDEAVACYQRALALKPDYARAHQNLLFCLNYLPQISQQEIYQQSLQWEAQVAKKLSSQAFLHFKSKDLLRKLRIGYVSADFKNHSVAYFIEPVLKAHDGENVEVYCYANVKNPDDRTQRLQAVSDHWHSIAGMQDVEAAERIREDRIDILVDLGGHTKDNRLLVFAYKPSPIQITWLGYPNTTGMRAIDYRFTDAIADPPGEADKYHSEKLIRLEHGFLCYQPEDSAPEVGPPPCLELGEVTFGSFNNLPKVTPEVVKVWAEILRQRPRSRLLLKSKILADLGVKGKYLRLFADQGIPADRLELLGWVPDKTNHLELYHRIDIGLDPFPYNGTTTTCEALWMGVPVVTLCGDRHAARVGASLMHHAGLEELVAPSEDEYITLAVTLAQDRQRLITLRGSQRRKMQESQLMDKKLFTATLEKAYRRMWRSWCTEDYHG
jgi:predicted O-linked N-acetylglucosamine transferase (SPINDLY family)